MMKVPPLSLVGMERLPLPLPFSPELLWRYNPLGPPPHHHPGGPHPPPGSPAAAAAAAAVFSRAAAAAASIPSPLAQQLPFAYDIKHTIPLNLASDPRLWSRDDVMTFMQWCEREFDLPSFDTERFQMNGKALCLLTKVDLESRAPCSGDVIHNALQILMSSSPSESPLTPHTPSSLRMQPLSGKGAWSIADLHHFASSQQQGTTSVTLSPAPSLDGQAGSPQEQGSANGNGVHSSSSASSSSNGSAGHNSDDSEYDSVGESPERSPVNQTAGSLSPPPRPASSVHPHNNNGSGPQQQLTTTTTTNSNGGGSNNNHHHHHQSSTHIHGGNSNGTTAQQQSTANNLSSNKPASFAQGGKLATTNNNNNSSGDGGEYNNNGRLLWDFLQQLLNDPSQRYSSFITWKNVETGIFKIVDPPGLARLWGIQKNHLSMNYDKMSRALRYYYRVNILRKVQGERHCYQFLRNPGELKSIKNISMLRHQNSPVSLTVKGEAPSFGENEYENLSMLRHQTSPVSLTRKSSPSTTGESTTSYNNTTNNNNNDNDYENSLSMLRQTQSSPMSLTTKSNSKKSLSAYVNHNHDDDDDDNDDQPVQLTVKVEPSNFVDNDYEDVPTDLSMDTTDRHHMKDED